MRSFFIVLIPRAMRVVIDLLVQKKHYPPIYWNRPGSWSKV